MSKPNFIKKVIGEIENNIPPGAMNTFSAVGDINNDGWLDVVISGRHGKMVWFENPGKDGAWKRHLIDDVKNMECGGNLYDLTGNGFLDVINGGDARSTEMCWWENPGAPEEKWKKHVIATTSFPKMHDTIIGDITNDGKLSLVFTNQKGERGTTIYYVPLPDDPTVSPWPGLTVIATDKSELNSYIDAGFQPEEGLALGDIDDDGKNELVSGTHWYKFTGSQWESHKFAAGYLATKCAIADINGDGRNEILLAEGDPCVFGKTQGGKVSWLTPKDDITGMWEEHVIEDFLFDAHSLKVGDICGNGYPDIFIGEIGKANQDRSGYIERGPRLLVFENDGKGHFTRHIINEGTGIHDSFLADIGNRGVLDIVGKPLAGDERWNVHVWWNNRV